jgi:hypothetical protein
MSERGSADAVEEFLQLEAKLSSGTKRTETYEQGNITGVAKIPAEEVPEDYPVSIRTREALHLDVETPGGETVATYIEWPDEDEESDHVERLLDASSGVTTSSPTSTATESPSTPWTAGTASTPTGPPHSSARTGRAATTRRR